MDFPPPIPDDCPKNSSDDDDDLFKSAIENPHLYKIQANHHQPIQALSDIDLNSSTASGDRTLVDDVIPEPVLSSRDLDQPIPDRSVQSPAPATLATVEPVVLKPAPVSTMLSNSPSVMTSSPVMTSLASRNGVGGDDSGEFIAIVVSNPQKVGDGMSAYMAYKVTTKTNLGYFKKTSFSVTRRFSDFLGLYAKLAEKHTHIGRIVPPAPEKSVVGMTKIKMTKDTDHLNSSSEFVEKRRCSLERYLNRTAAHPLLRTDPDFREFVELDDELPKATHTSALSGASVLKIFNRVGDTVNKIAFKMDETDPWFEDKRQQIENLDQQFRKMLSSFESLITHRRDLCLSTSQLAKALALISNCEEHVGLSQALCQLADTHDKIEAVHDEQTNMDWVTLVDFLKDYVAMLGAIKEVFTQRVKVYQTWQHAEQMLNRKREQKAKAELIGKQDKIQIAKDEEIEWKAKVERGQEEFDNISKIIKKEVERFEAGRVREFRAVVIKNIESLISSQEETVKHWETFLPAPKAIL